MESAGANSRKRSVSAQRKVIVFFFLMATFLDVGISCGVALSRVPYLHYDAKAKRLGIYSDGTLVCCIGRKDAYFILEEQGKAPVEIPVRSMNLQWDAILPKKPEVGSGDQSTTVAKNLKVTGELGGLGRFEEAFEVATLGGFPVITSRLRIVLERSSNFILLRPYSFAARTQPCFLVPGYIYNTNNQAISEGQFPQLAYGSSVGIPESSVFFFRSDRSSHCAVMAMHDGWIVGLCSQEGIRLSPDRFSYNGLGIDSSQKESDALYLTVGYKNFPARYNGNCSPHIAPRWEKGPEYGYIRAHAGDVITVESVIYAARASDLFAYENADRAFYYFLRQEPMRRTTRAEAVRLISDALVSDAVSTPSDLFRVIDGSEECDIGWTGGMMIAYPLLRAGKMYGQKSWSAAAIAAIDALCRDGFNARANMFYDCFKEGEWTTRGWWTYWTGGEHLAYTNGQAVYFILRSYRELGPEERAQKHFWLVAAEKVLRQAIRQQREDGSFAGSFSSQDGSAVDLPGFGSCWFVPACVLMYELSGEKEFLDAAIRAEKFYFEWLATLEPWGTPLDAEGSVDMEGNLALCIAERHLHEATGNSLYLDHLERSINFDFSWKWAYNTYLESNPLRGLEWRSIGGNSASTCNIHLHPMSNMILGEIWYAYKKTGDTYYLDRLRDSFYFGLGCVNLEDGEFGFGKKGWVTEQFLHTDALQGGTSADGGVWERYLPWAAAAILTSLTEEFAGEINY
jgi:hypothetical protein